MPRFFIQRVRFRPAGEERPDTPHAGYECIVSPVDVTEDPAVVSVRYEQLKPLLDLWKLEQPIELARHQFDAPERYRDPQAAFEYLLDLVNRQIDPELIQPGWYLAHVAQALADLRCPRFDAVQLAGSKRFFGGAFDADGELNQTWLATLAAEVHRRSGGIVTLEEAESIEFTMNPPKPVAYLVVTRGDERLWCILRPWPQGIPLVTDDDLAQEGTARRSSFDASPEARLIELYNEQYAKIFAAAAKKERDKALQRDVASFLSGTTGLAELFAGLSLQADGTLDSDGVLANLASIRTPQKLTTLHQGLSEFLDFLLFSSMEPLDRASEQELARQTQALLREGGEDAGDVSATTDIGEVFEMEDVDASPGGALTPGDLTPLNLDEIARMPKSPPELTLEEHNELTRLAPMRGQGPIPPPPFDLLPPPLPPVHLPGSDEERAQETATALRALSTAEGEANLAIEKLERLVQLVRHVQDTSEREWILHSIEHIRVTLREIAKARDGLRSLPARRR